ncbi:prealbumin-like fold domain-containing protein [Salinicoccus bachuensis]|uniref:Prealbumin-like fold domain-containing protein n=1 Tax=Salinicoccus bachuensis TaxID=3136731 RepID=A0ABZ3CIP8_9STAP
MRKIAYYIAIILFIILIPVSRVAADTHEEATQENSQDPSTEDTMEEPTSEPSAEEEYTGEYYEEWTEETYDYVPPQTEETYEEWTEESYEDSYEDYEPEPTVEQTLEPTVEEFTQEVIEEPVEVPTEEPVVEMEPVKVNINQSEVTEFSIEGKVMAGAKGVEDVTVSLSGEKEDEAVTDAEGKFQFPEVPAGDYTLEMDVPEGYEADEADKTLTIDNKGKKGLVFDLSEKDEPQAENLEPEEQVSAGENIEDPGMNTMLVIMGSVLLMLGLLIYAIRMLRNR